MSIKIRVAGAALAVLALATVALADIAAPNNNNRGRRNDGARNANTSRMVIEAGEGAREARLQIPRGMLKQLRAEIDQENPSNAASLGGGEVPPAHTIIAGVFLSLSIVFGGLWVVCSKRRSPAQRVAAAFAVCALCGCAATAVAFANALPPSLPRDPGTLPQAITNGAALTGTVRVEIVEGGNEIKLIVPKSAATVAEVR
ncbi:MAG: hypothetical protein ACRD68_01825 [Pyrinomonadaceae bacterium]